MLTCKTIKVRTRAVASPTTKLLMQAREAPRIHVLTDTLSGTGKISLLSLRRRQIKGRRFAPRKYPLTSLWWTAAIKCPNSPWVPQATSTIARSMLGQTVTLTRPWERKKTIAEARSVKAREATITISWRGTRGIRSTIAQIAPMRCTRLAPSRMHWPTGIWASIPQTRRD